MIDKNLVNEFLQQSNWIENERSKEALEDAQLAWKYAYKNRDNITVHYVLEIHRLLMHRLRPDIAGKIRNCDVMVGGHLCTNPDFVERMLFLWTDSIGKFAYYQTDVEASIKYEHIAFEAIHPFEDGNGRVGRILYNIHRLKLGLPIHIIHEGEEQMEYYKWFK
jgi:cell filamentation protein